MKQIDITNKNKDLDLRRFGKGIYTKKSGNGEGGNSGGGSGDSENDEELNAFMEFFDGLDDSLKKLPFNMPIDEYNVQPLPEQYELFGDKETASRVLVFMTEPTNTPDYAAAFISDDLCSKLMGWCFNYYGYNVGDDGMFVPIDSIRGGNNAFLAADKLPLLVEKCMDSNEFTDIPQGLEASFAYVLSNSISLPTKHPYTLFLVNFSDPNIISLVFTFEEGDKTYYAPGTLVPSGTIG